MGARTLIVGMSMLAATAGTAAELPLKPGTYVEIGVPCHDPAFAAVFAFDGRQFLYPHATHCRSVVRSHSGKTYRVDETCTAAGDGSPTAPATSMTTYTINSPTRVVVRQAQAKFGESFRWCPTPVSSAFK